uniref:Uncharacterized protein n=1 Tax=Arundo donax TaxID=35708 RepID=A0A0A8YRL8_ARUDO
MSTISLLDMIQCGREKKELYLKYMADGMRVFNYCSIGMRRLRKSHQEVLFRLTLRLLMANYIFTGSFCALMVCRVMQTIP